MLQIASSIGLLVLMPNISISKETDYTRTPQLTDKNFQMLYECEEERMVYKSCLRKLITLKRSIKHTSWDTADVSALYLS